MSTDKKQMDSLLSPISALEFAEAVHSVPHAIAVGAGTKPRLSHVPEKFTRISTAKLRGIVEYEPSEFTFTALAGTPVQEIVTALAERGQYLPFDPLLVAEGATVGGMVAAGLSGPGRFRFGGLRDFILAVQFIDGSGRLLRLGGKVVKNAAGFDLPKFLVGSVGRFGALTEVTFKVFPKPIATRTLRIEAKDSAAKARMLSEAGSARWEIDALEAAVDDDAIFARLAGPAVALEALSAEIFQRWPGAILAETEAAALWRKTGGLIWAHPDGGLAKVVLSPAQAATFIDWVRALPGARGWVSAGGNLGFVSVAKGSALPELPWSAMTLRGEAPLWPGVKPRFEIMAAVKTALDPLNRFPHLDD